MAIDMEVGAYRSPPGKLIRIFKRGRDAWKRKCQDAKTLVKLLSNRAGALRKSRDRWKMLAKQREKELRQLRRPLDLGKKRPR